MSVVIATRVSHAPILCLCFLYPGCVGATPGLLPSLGRYSALGPQGQDPQWSLVGSQGAQGTLMVG